MEWGRVGRGRWWLANLRPRGRCWIPLQFPSRSSLFGSRETATTLSRCRGRMGTSLRSTRLTSCTPWPRRLRRRSVEHGPGLSPSPLRSGTRRRRRERFPWRSGPRCMRAESWQGQRPNTLTPGPHGDKRARTHAVDSSGDRVALQPRARDGRGGDCSSRRHHDRKRSYCTVRRPFVGGPANCSPAVTKPASLMPFTDCEAATVSQSARTDACRPRAAHLRACGTQPLQEHAQGDQMRVGGV